MTATEWTLDELTARVAAALDGAAYAGAPNGRVRDVPDARAIRWYATIGLLDRPTVRGRIALYGPRHLLQLVAIKRRQSQGMRIADIQAELADASDEVLRAIAGAPLPALDLPDEAERAAEPSADSPGSSRQRFWASPAPASPPVAVPAPLPSAVAGPLPSAGAAPAPAQVVSALLSGVPLAGGAVLLLPATPGPDDVTAIQAAAGPLLDLLAARGLLPRTPTTSTLATTAATPTASTLATTAAIPTTSTLANTTIQPNPLDTPNSGSAR